MSTKRTYTHYPIEQLAKQIVKLNHLTAAQLGVPYVLRKAEAEGLVKPLKNRKQRTGLRGKPAQIYAPTIKARTLARKAA